MLRARPTRRCQPQDRPDKQDCSLHFALLISTLLTAGLEPLMSSCGRSESARAALRAVQASKHRAAWRATSSTESRHGLDFPSPSLAPWSAYNTATTSPPIVTGHGERFAAGRQRCKG